MTGNAGTLEHGKIGVVCNVGPLVEADFANDLPERLSPGTAESCFRTPTSRTSGRPPYRTVRALAGWGGRIADRTADLNIVTFPAVTSVAGTPISPSGNVERPLAIAPAPTALNAALAIERIFCDPSVRDADPRYIALQNLMLNDTGFTLIRGASRVPALKQ